MMVSDPAGDRARHPVYVPILLVPAMFALLALASCAGQEPDFKQTVVTADNQAEVYEQIRNGTVLTGEELELLQAYLQRQELPGGQYLPTGKSIEQMIQEQRGFMEGLAAAQGESDQPAEAGPAGEQTPGERTADASKSDPPPTSPGAGSRTPDSGPRASATPPATRGQPSPEDPPQSRSVSTKPKPAPTLVVPAGTTLKVRLEESISSKRNRAGDRFEASLDRDLVVDGRVVAPRGSRVIGRITEAKQSGRVKGRARLAVTVEELRVDGKSLRLRANVLSFQADPSKKSDAKKIGIGAGAGAVIGAIAGGGKGAAIGTAIGAGAGTGAVLVTSGKEVEFRTEQLFQFKLKDDLVLKLT